MAPPLLQKQHYLRMPINDDVSSKFLDRYLDSLDNLHIYFTQGTRKIGKLLPLSPCGRGGWG